MGPPKKPHLQQSLIAQLTAKAPRASENPESYRDSRPVWRVSFMDMSGDWGWHGLTNDAWRQVQSRLTGFEGRTWKEIEQQQSCGEVPVDAICKEAQARLLEIGREGNDTLRHLRINGASRVWGVREAHVLYLLWWDPNHTVYPMNITDN